MIDSVIATNNKEINRTKGPQFTFKKLITIRKKLFTPKRFLENTNFLIRSINNLSFTTKLLVKKNPKKSNFHDNNILCQILSKIKLYLR